MKMTKICQRLNNKLITVLDILSKEAEQHENFSHVTHTVKFDCFPASLLVLVHYQANNVDSIDVQEYKSTETLLQKQLHRLLLKKGIVLKKPAMNLKVQSA